MLLNAIVLLLATFLVNANDQCRWRGTAPVCRGSCLSGEYEPFNPPRDGYGKGCIFGEKKYCCKINSCTFHGTAPICKPDDCADGHLQVATSVKGTGAPCWGGTRKKFCCPIRHSRRVTVSLSHGSWFSRTTESYDQNADCINVKQADYASSVDTHETCVRLYNEENCSGKTVALITGSPSHNNLENLDFNDLVKSVGPCFENDQQRSNLVRRGWEPSLLAAAVFIGLNSLLREDRSNLRGPVTVFQTGYDDRPEAMMATIRRNHIATGTPTTGVSRGQTRLMGYDTDDAGHILGSQLGGSGTDRRNLFPQSPHINRGAFAQSEGMVRDLVQLHGQVVYTVNLVYSGATTTRPIRILVRIQFTDNNGIAHDIKQDFLNP